MVLYWMVWVAVRIWYFGILRVRLEGVGHLPRRGGYVLCSNHISWQDPMLLGAAMPKQVHFMAKAEAFASPVGGLILRVVGAFPVRRHTADRGAIRRALGLLHTGKPVVVFPEGTRSRDGRLGQAEPGAALLALWSGSDVVPVGISGRYRPGQLRIRVGAPFRLEHNGRASAQDLQRMAQEEIMGAVRKLVSDGRDRARIAPGPA